MKAFPLRSATICEAAISRSNPSNLVTVFLFFIQQKKGHLYVLERFKSIFWGIITKNLTKLKKYSGKFYSQLANETRRTRVKGKLAVS